MSDIGGGSGSPSGRGGSGTSWWVWVGGGCAIIFVIAAILFIFGAYKGVTCCQEKMQAGQQAPVTAVFFAAQLREGDLEGAYGRLSAGYTDESTMSAFTDRIASHREAMEGSVPEPLDTHFQYGSKGGGDSGSYWEISVGFLRGDVDRLLVMKVRLLPTGEGEETSFQVDALTFDRRPRRPREEPPVMEVVVFLSSYASGETAAAQGILGPPDGSGEQIWSVVESNPEVFESEDFRNLDVQYQPPSQAIVDVDQVGRSGEASRVRYRLARRNLSWWITGIELDPPAAPTAEEAETGGSDAGHVDVSGGDAGDAESDQSE